MNAATRQSLGRLEDDLWSAGFLAILVTAIVLIIAVVP